MARNEVRINIIGDARRLKAALDDAESSLGSKIEGMGRKLQDFGKKMSTFVTLPVVGAGVAAFQMASDFNESFSKMSTVFGESAKDIAEWSKGSAKAFGLSRKEALDAAGTFGNMFTQLGIGAPKAAELSKGLVQLAADLGSFHNVDITTVIDAQTSAFRGEYDALQRFIPTINAASVEQKAMEMTGKDNAKALTAQEKALAAQQLMMEDAGAAVGDFSRTSDGAANQQRILTAEFKDAATEMGDNLLPIGQKIVEWVGKLAEKFNKLTPEQQNMILMTAGLAAAIGPLTTAIGGLSTAIAFLAANPMVALAAGFAIITLAVIAAKKEWVTFPDPIIVALNGVLMLVNGAVQPFLELFDAILSGATMAFGWMPGLGPKLKQANADFDNFKNSVLNALAPIPTSAERIAQSIREGSAAMKEMELHLDKLRAAGVDLGGRSFVPAGQLPPGAMMHRAAGGPVSAGSPYIIGERGPELFVPGQSGTVIPNGVGGTMVVNLTVNGAVDSAGVARQIQSILLEEKRRSGALGLA